MEKAIVKKGEITLSFSKSLKKKDINHFILKNPYRNVYDFKNTRLSHNRVPLGLGSNVRITQHKKNKVRLIIKGDKKSKSRFSKKKYHISVSKKKKRVKSKSKVIVIDAGHGGHDTGAISGGKKEKDLVLQIAKKLEKELKRKGYRVYMTRSRDRFINLSNRTKIADKKDAALFISIHANAIAKRKQNKTKGVETFFLQNTRDKTSQRIAARENKAVLKGTNRLSRNVIIDSVLSGPKIVESNKFAIDVQGRILTNLQSRYKGVRDGGVRSAPFWVLVGASRPSILVEVGYISHPTERKRLFTPRYQNLIVKGIAQGVDNYLLNRKREIDF